MRSEWVARLIADLSAPVTIDRLALPPSLHKTDFTSAYEMSTILKVESLTKLYRSGGHELVVLDGIGFSVEAGASCAVVGPSGSGKTTLLGICAGLDEPTEGTVALDGMMVNSLDEDGRARLRNRSVGFVFQNFQLIPTLTALENVMVPLELRGQSGAGDRASDLLNQVGLGDRLGHYPVQLSGGEQQRVALARAFINQPRILFADEPTGNLDGETAQRVVDLLFQLNADAGTTLILVTHDFELASRTGRTIRLRNGRMDLEAPTIDRT
jgi:putative ABC transport system ATP-binding protein